MDSHEGDVRTAEDRVRSLMERMPGGTEPVVLEGLVVTAAMPLVAQVVQTFAKARHVAMDVHGDDLQGHALVALMRAIRKHRREGWDAIYFTAFAEEKMRRYMASGLKAMQEQLTTVPYDDTAPPLRDCCIGERRVLPARAAA